VCGLTAAQDFVGTTTIALTHAANSRSGKPRVVPPATTSDSSPTRPPNPHKPRSITPAPKMVPPTQHKRCHPPNCSAQLVLLNCARLVAQLVPSTQFELPNGATHQPNNPRTTKSTKSATYLSLRPSRTEAWVPILWGGRPLKILWCHPHFDVIKLGGTFRCC
jgi:hypothetical protein